jgi:hypothetical protein
VTFTDQKDRSHGDLLTTAVSTALNNGRDFAGGFNVVTGGSFGNSDSLTGNNKQATRVSGLPAGIEGTVEDGAGTSGSCGSLCSTTFGEWSVVNVNGGKNVDGGFTIQITYKTGTPTGFVHSYLNELGETVVEQVGPCAATPVSPCFTWTGHTATIYTLHNGSWKGL